MNIFDEMVERADRLHLNAIYYYPLVVCLVVIMNGFCSIFCPLNLVFGFFLARR